MKWVFIAAVVVVVAVLMARSAAGNRIDSQAAQTLVADGAVLLDVRSAGEFSGGHIEGAKNIAVQELAGRLGELPELGRAIVVYCHSGGRSARAASILRAKGYSAVHDLGPKSAWR